MRSVTFTSATILLSAVVATACSSSPTAGEPEAIKSQNSADTVYNAAYPQCMQILRDSIFDETDEAHRNANRNDILAAWCNMDSGSAYEKYKSDYDSLHDHSSGGKGSFSLAGLIDASGGGKDATKDRLTTDEFGKRFGEFKSSHCGEYKNYDDTEFVANVVRRSMNSEAIKAWRACVTTKATGLACVPSSESGSDTVSVLLSYKKPSDYFPNKLAIHLDTEKNVERLSQRVPSTIGPTQGTEAGLQLDYRLLDPAVDTLITVNADIGMDDGSTYNTSCGIRIPKARPPFALNQSYRRLPLEGGASIELPSTVGLERQGENFFSTDSIREINDEGAVRSFRISVGHVPMDSCQPSKAIRMQTDSGMTAYVTTQPGDDDGDSYIDANYPMGSTCLNMEFSQPNHGKPMDFDSKSPFASAIRQIIRSFGAQ